MDSVKKIDGRSKNGGHKPKGEPREAITPLVLPKTAEYLRSMSKCQKISIGKSIDFLMDFYKNSQITHCTAATKVCE